MFKLMGKKTVTILRQKSLLYWPYAILYSLLARGDFYPLLLIFTNSLDVWTQNVRPEFDTEIVPEKQFEKSLQIDNKKS